ncbi:MAG: CAP domain-containing protein [Phycisphaerae bacterium]
MQRRKLAKLAWIGFLISLPLFVLLCGCGASVPNLFPIAAGQSSSITDPAAQQVLTLTNQERTKIGLSALKWNSLLAASGADHCQDMIDKNYFAHVSPDGTSPGDRATAAGYKWSWIGENIAAGYATPQDVMTGWMNSPEHKENILRPEFTELGLGIRTDTDGRIYWAQEFGTPSTTTGWQ